MNKSTRSFSTKASILDSAQQFWSQLRWKAVQSIASSLSPTERETLLKTWSPPTKENNNNNNGSNNNTNTESAAIFPHTSIAEAVAQARMDEAQKLTKHWETRKEELMQQAEEAARARVENDMLLQRRQVEFEEWKAKVAAAKHTKDYSFVSPLLGKVVSDLGYKRLHLVSARDLANVKIWQEQRIYRHNRAKAMAADKMRTLHLGIPGVVSLYEDETGNLSIIDGQHRVGMMTILQDKLEGNSSNDDDNDVNNENEKDIKNNTKNNNNNKQNNSSLGLDNILVEVYPHQSGHNTIPTDLFLEINKAEPVKLVDMPGMVKQADRKIITLAAEKLCSQYPAMFKTSTRCRPPHLNIDNMRDALFASNIITKRVIRSRKALYAWMMEQNTILAEKYNNDANKTVIDALPPGALEKARANDLYLGLESGWYYNS